MGRLEEVRPDKKCFASRLQLPPPDLDSLIIICNTRAHHYLLLIVSVKHPLDLLWPPLYGLSDNLIHL